MMTAKEFSEKRATPLSDEELDAICQREIAETLSSRGHIPRFNVPRESADRVLELLRAAGWECRENKHTYGKPWAAIEAYEPVPPMEVFQIGDRLYLAEDQENALELHGSNRADWRPEDALAPLVHKLAADVVRTIWPAFGDAGAVLTAGPARMKAADMAKSQVRGFLGYTEETE